MTKKTLKKLGVAVLLTLSLALTPTGASAQPTTDDPAFDTTLIANEVFRISNAYRVYGAGANGMIRSPHIDRFAQAQAQELLDTGTFRHNGKATLNGLSENLYEMRYMVPNSKGIITRARHATGSNLAAQVVQAFRNSPGHNRNLIRSWPDYTQMGVGVAVKDGRFIVVVCQKGTR